MAAVFAGTKNWDKEGTGYVGGLSAEQEAILKRFLDAVSTEVEALKFVHEPAEVFACRFLRARKFDVDAAIELARNSFKWAQEQDIPKLKQMTYTQALGACSQDELNMFYKRTWVPGCYDREGRPVFLELSGKIDMAAVALICDEDGLMRHHVRSIVVDVERETEAATKRSGKLVNGSTTIIDLSGFSSSMFNSQTRAFMKRMSEVDQNNFPELLGSMYVINTPAVFSAVWAVCKGFVDERTRSKIHILRGPSAYEPALREAIDPKLLPKQYGGEAEIPDLFPESRTVQLHVASGKTHTEDIAAKKGQRVRVRWFSRPGDIKWSMVVIDGETQLFVHPLQAAKNSGTELQQITHQVDIDCIVRVTYDNSAGWRGREVFHRFDFIDDAGHPIEPEIGIGSTAGFTHSMAAGAMAAAAAGGAGGPAAPAGAGTDSAAGAGGGGDSGAAAAEGKGE